MPDKGDFIYWEPQEVRTEEKVRADNCFILLKRKGKTRKITSVMWWRSQDPNPGLLPSPALFSLWPSPASSVPLFGSSHKTEMSAHKSVVTYSLTVTRASGQFRSSSVWGNEDVVLPPDPDKDVLREMSHLKTNIKFHFTVWWIPPNSSYLSQSLSLFSTLTYFFFANLLMNHINRSIFSTTENDNIQKEEQKDQIYFQEISKDW